MQSKGVVGKVLTRFFNTLWSCTVDAPPRARNVGLIQEVRWNATLENLRDVRRRSADGKAFAYAQCRIEFIYERNSIVDLELGDVAI